MARSRSTIWFSVLLLLCVMLTAAQGESRRTGARPVTLNRRKRTFGTGLFGAKPDWSRVHDSFVNDLSKLQGSMMSLFKGEDMMERFGKRIADLEKDQNRIINNLRQVLVSLREPCMPASPDVTRTPDFNRSPSFANWSPIGERPHVPNLDSPCTPTAYGAGAAAGSSSPTYQSTPVRPPPPAKKEPPAAPSATYDTLTIVPVPQLAIVPAAPQLAIMPAAPQLAIMPAPTQTTAEASPATPVKVEAAAKEPAAAAKESEAGHTEGHVAPDDCKDAEGGARAKHSAELPDVEVENEVDAKW